MAGLTLPYGFRRGFSDALRGARPRLVVLEASSMIGIDFTAAQILADVIQECRAAHIAFAIARLESRRGQEALARFGILKILGQDRLFHSVQEAIDACLPGNAI